MIMTDVMLQAHEAVGTRSWSTPQEPIPGGGQMCGQTHAPGHGRGSGRRAVLVAVRSEAPPVATCTCIVQQSALWERY
jgi:hypothetical protein